jgi:hypothetical protein
MKESRKTRKIQKNKNKQKTHHFRLILKAFLTFATKRQLPHG